MLSSDADKSRHERYLSVFQLLQQRSRELADTLDDLRHQQPCGNGRAYTRMIC
jgi:hypothetical protein